MASTRTWRRGAAIRRRQRAASAESFRTEVCNSLPRMALDAETAWEANRIAIERSMEADRWLRDNGFDRWGNEIGGGSRG